MRYWKAIELDFRKLVKVYDGRATFPEEFVPIVLMRRMGCTYQELCDTPDFIVDLVIQDLNAESDANKIIKQRNRNKAKARSKKR